MYFMVGPGEIRRSSCAGARSGASTVGSACIGVSALIHAAFLGVVGQHDPGRSGYRSAATLVSFTLDHGVNADALFSQGCR